MSRQRQHIVGDQQGLVNAGVPCTCRLRVRVRARVRVRPRATLRARVRVRVREGRISTHTYMQGRVVRHAV